MKKVRFFPPSDLGITLMTELKKAGYEEYDLNDNLNVEEKDKRNPLLTAYAIGTSIIMIVRDNGEYQTYDKAEFIEQGLSAPHHAIDLSEFGITISAPFQRERKMQSHELCYLTYS